MLDNQANLIDEQSLKGTETTGNGLFIANREQNNNVTDLFKEDSVSSDQPVHAVLNSGNQYVNGQQQDEFEHNQIRKFMKKAEKINETSYRKLHWGKPLMPEPSTLNIYKSNKNILEQISFPSQRDRQIKQIYFKSARENKRTHQSNKNTHRKSLYQTKKKVTTDSKWVQTDINTQNAETIKLQNKKKTIDANWLIKKHKKSLKAIEEDEDQQFIPVKRKNPQRVFNTINLTSDLKRAKVDANSYLMNVSKAQHEFNSSLKRYSVKQQYQQKTFYHGSERTSFQPIGIQSQKFPWNDEEISQKNNQEQMPKISRQADHKIINEQKKIIENQQISIPKIVKKITEDKRSDHQTTQNSLFVQNNNSIKKTEISDGEFTMAKINNSNNFDDKNTTGFISLNKNDRTISVMQSSAQAPQIRQIAIGTQTNNFIMPSKKLIHPINIGFNQNDSSWITSQYKPKSEFIKKIDTSAFSIKKYRNGVYFGELSDQGLKHGRGVVFYFNGRSYEGNFIGDIKQGKGFQYMPDGSTYSGDFKKGLKEGRGIFEWANGQVYDGQWIGGKKNGSGMWKSPKGDSYLGEWRNGKIQGFGVLSIREGDRYQGQFKNSMKSGLGTERYSNGDTYVGQFSSNRPNGQGQYYNHNGDTYKGFFSNGLKHGNGYLKTKNQTYQGQFRNDKKCGYGQQTNQQGITYKGNFQNDLKHGYGEQTKQNNTIKGYWINGEAIQTQMGPIIQDQLDRQQSVAVNMKLKKKKRNSLETNTQVKTSPRIQKMEKKKSPRASIEHSSIQKELSPGDPNFNRACGCRRKH